MNTIVKWMSYMALIVFCMGGGGLLFAFGGRIARTWLNFEVNFLIGAILGLAVGIVLVIREIKDGGSE